MVSVERSGIWASETAKFASAWPIMLTRSKFSKFLGTVAMAPSFRNCVEATVEMLLLSTLVSSGKVVAAGAAASETVMSALLVFALSA